MKRFELHLIVIKSKDEQKKNYGKKSANQLQTSTWNAASLSIWNDESGNFMPTLRRLCISFYGWLISASCAFRLFSIFVFLSFIYGFFPAFTAYFFVSVNSFEKWRWPTLQCSMWPRCYLLHFLFVYSLFWVRMKDVKFICSLCKYPNQWTLQMFM